MSPPLRSAATALLLLLALAGPAGAQAIGEGGDGKLVTLQGIRSATVAPAGLGFAAFALSGRTDDDPDDGLASSLSLGTGFGDARGGVGVQVTASFGAPLDGLGESGSLGLKFAHRFAGSGRPTFLALSFDRLAGWGDRADLDPTTTVALTTFPRLALGADSYPLMVTLGAGSHIRDDGTEPGLYAGAGIGLTRNFGASLAWTGEDVTVGAVAKVPGLDNWRFTASVLDALDQEDGRRLSITATFVVQDLFGSR